MVIKITPQQAKKVNALLRKLCANYDGGNCLLLDDGEPCVCVQSISKYGIYCNYFKNAVLPVDEGLLTKDVIKFLMSEEKPNQREIVKILTEKLREFAPDANPRQLEDFVLKACEHYRKYLIRQRGREER